MDKGKILIIEDDRDFVEKVERNLKREGYKTISAFNGEDGIALARKYRPDLIFLDVMLPITDGFGVCRDLKNKNSTAGIPIIILSARAQETDKVIGLEMGADEYVTNPFNSRELIAKVRMVLEKGAVISCRGLGTGSEKHKRQTK